MVRAAILLLAFVLVACRRDEAPTASASTAASMAAPSATAATTAAGAVVTVPPTPLLPNAPPPPPDMLVVPGGEFTMGADRGGEEDEHPAHRVNVAGFFLDKTEVTNAQWTECVTASACRPKSESVRANHPDFDGPTLPVTGISWDDASKYCAWRGKRLPREAEFEKAVRDTDDRRFPWGNDSPTVEKSVFSTSRPEEVATHPAGRGPYGHDDLAGNVWEWIEDEYDPYAYRRPGASDGTPGTCAEILTACDDLRREHKQGFTGSNPIPVECEHSIRGGAYNYDAFGLRSTNRVHHPGHFRIPMLGLRCAKNVP